MVTLKPSTSHWKNVNESKLYQINKRAAPNPHEHKATFELHARGGIAPAWLDAHPPWRPGCPCPAVLFARGPWEPGRRGRQQRGVHLVRGRGLMHDGIGVPRGEAASDESPEKYLTRNYTT